MGDIFTVENAIALLTLTMLEVVLGIDNVVFISILTGRLDPAQRGKARRLGLALAMIMRIILLLAIGWVMSLTRPLFTPLGHEVSGKDLIMLLGGLFLIAKATYEIHGKLEDSHTEAQVKKAVSSFSAAVGQIVVIDMVFSLDSVITAVGMAKHVSIMIAAVMIAVAIMMAFAGAVSGFVEKHPTLKMLALAFLLLIGVMLTAEGLGQHIPKGYIYFAMAFSLGVEMLNLRANRRHPPAGPELPAAAPRP